MNTATVYRTCAAATSLALIFCLTGRADPTPFHRAPLEATQLVNPYANQPQAIQVGSELYRQHCAVCHGGNAAGSGSVPALAHGAVQTAAAGEVFWFITKGSVSGAMPSWASLPEQQRWQLVSFLQTLRNAPAPAAGAADSGRAR
jgi:mono/diheme cytochrome c family protein